MIDIVYGISVDTPIGRITGETLTKFLNPDIYKFSSIPYTNEFMGGNNRWKLSEMRTHNLTDNGTVFDATQDIQDCTKTEDCLKLNIFTPDVTASNPVLIWIHGGAFLIGGAQSGKGDAMARKNVVGIHDYQK